jgi:hypothetical protein
MGHSRAAAHSMLDGPIRADYLKLMGRDMGPCKGFPSRAFKLLWEEGPEPLHHRQRRIFSLAAILSSINYAGPCDSFTQRSMVLLMGNVS